MYKIVEERFQKLYKQYAVNSEQADEYSSYLKYVSEDGTNLFDVPQEFQTNELVLQALETKNNPVHLSTRRAIENYCCPLNMIDLSELVVFPTSSDDLRLSKPSCACALVLFFGSYCVWRAFYHGGQRFLPVFLRVLQEPLYVDIVHQHDSHYRGQP